MAVKLPMQFLRETSTRLQHAYSFMITQNFIIKFLGQRWRSPTFQVLSNQYVGLNLWRYVQEYAVQPC